MTIVVGYGVADNWNGLIRYVQRNAPVVVERQGGKRTFIGRAENPGIRLTELLLREGPVSGTVIRAVTFDGVGLGNGPKVRESVPGIRYMVVDKR